MDVSRSEGSLHPGSYMMGNYGSETSFNLNLDYLKELDDPSSGVDTGRSTTELTRMTRAWSSGIMAASSETAATTTAPQPSPAMLQSSSALGGDGDGAEDDKDAGSANPAGLVLSQATSSQKRRARDESEMPREVNSSTFKKLRLQSNMIRREKRKADDEVARLMEIVEKVFDLEHKVKGVVEQLENKVDRQKFAAVLKYFDDITRRIYPSSQGSGDDLDA